jgi:Tfp pilus assembly protein PilF
MPVTRQSSQAIPIPRTQTEPRVSPPTDGIRIAGARANNPRLASALELLARQQWDAARAALTALANESPQSNQIAALLAYATGRQAQIEDRAGEARIELNRALQLDPDLALAKTALNELFGRRK